MQCAVSSVRKTVVLLVVLARVVSIVVESNRRGTTLSDVMVLAAVKLLVPVRNLDSSGDEE